MGRIQQLKSLAFGVRTLRNQAELAVALCITTLLNPPPPPPHPHLSIHVNTARKPPLHKPRNHTAGTDTLRMMTDYQIK